MDWGPVWSGVGVAVSVVALIRAWRADCRVRRVEERAEEVWRVGWSGRWDRQDGVLTLTNTGRDLAGSVTVVLNARLPFNDESLHRSEDTIGDIGEGECFTVSLPELTEDRKDMMSVATRDVMGRLYLLQGGRWKTRLSCDIYWKTGKGFTSSEHLDLSIS